MKVNAKDRELNGRSTTMRWLREHKDEAEQRQWDIMTHNTTAARRLIERVGTLPPERRMVRLGSEMLQGYTEKDWKTWWQQPNIQSHLENLFAPVGEMSRKLGVKVSFHPGQFCVLSSATPDIVERSIEEFELVVSLVCLTLGLLDSFFIIIYLDLFINYIYYIKMLVTRLLYSARDSSVYSIRTNNKP